MYSFVSTGRKVCGLQEGVDSDLFLPVGSVWHGRYKASFLRNVHGAPYTVVATWQAKHALHVIYWESFMATALWNLRLVDVAS